MKKYNLYESMADLKPKLGINICFGEASFRPNANIREGSIAPIILFNEHNQKYLHCMKWGIQQFDSQRRLTINARSEGITENQSWSPLIQNGQKCVIVCKGYYFYQATEIFDAKKRTKYTDKQPLYVSPYRATEGEFMYIAGVYKTRRTFRGKQYSFVALTQSVESDHRFSGYSINRIPLFLRPCDVDKWLDKRQSCLSFIGNSFKMKLNEFQKIGFWLNDKNVVDENVILQSREQWDRDQDAMQIFGQGDINWDEIEQEALRQNDAKKTGVADKCREPKHGQNENTNTAYSTAPKQQQRRHSHQSQVHEQEEDALEVLDEDKELKQEEEITPVQVTKKRKRDSMENMNENVHSPPNKKQKVDPNAIADADENGNMFPFDDEYSSSDNQLHQKPRKVHSNPIRRQSVETNEQRLERLKKIKP